jgi:uncharacterized lipoprotein YmbA
MQATARRTCLIVPFVFLGLTGCFKLGRNPPIERQYVLGGAPPPAAVASSGKLAGKSVGIRRLELAPYLVRPFILVRRGPHRITFSEFHRWAEDVDAGISRAMGGYLAARAPLRAVAVAPWPLGEKFDFLIQLRVLQFEGLAPEEPAVGDGEARVLATWEIIRQQDGVVLARGTTDYRQPGWRADDYAGLVKLLDTGLSTLSEDLVASLESLMAP